MSADRPSSPSDRAGPIGRLPCALFALGLLLSLATQLRPGGLPIGPGEACLLLAIMSMMTKLLIRKGSATITPALWAALLFWLSFLMAQSIGFVVAGLIGDAHDMDLVIHDATTYPLLMAVTGLTVFGPDADARARTTAWCVAIFGAVMTMLQLAGGFGMFAIPGIDPWYWDRFRGWTSNPNQFALYCLFAGAVSLQLVEIGRTGKARAAALAFAGIEFGAGSLAKTNAFTLAMTVILGLFCILKLTGWAGQSGSRLSWRAAIAWTVILTAPIGAASILPFAASQSGGNLMNIFARDGSGDTDQEAKIRFQLWSKAIERGFEANMLGLGPGPHLPIPAVLLEARWGAPFEPINVQHPTPGAAPNFEAHNTLLELFVQGGLLAVASFLAVFAASARRYILTTSLLGMLIFGSFHVISRHPAVWFLIAWGLTSPVSPGRMRLAGNQGSMQRGCAYIRTGV